MRMGIGLTGVLQASEEQLSWLNEGYEYLRDFDKRYSEIHNINESIKLTTIKPSGCSIRETLLLTENGLLYLDEIGDTEGEDWQDIELPIAQERSNEMASKFFVNGIADTIKIVTDGGILLESTHNHQYRVLTDSGEYIWKAMKDIEVGDKIPYKVGGYNGGSSQPLTKIVFGGRSTPIFQPEFISEGLAFILGSYFADGSNHTKGIRIAGNTTTKLNHMNNLISLFKSELNYEAKLYERPGTINLDLYATSQPILNWLSANGLLKQKSENLEIPLIIRKSPKNIILSFLEGFFAGDGYKNKDTRTWTTVSYKLAQQLPVILRYLGIDAKVSEMPPTESSFGTKMRYWISERKGRYADDRYIKNEVKSTWKQLDSIGLDNFSFDTVVNKTESENYTFDIEVKVNNCYIAGSYVSHNTLSLIPGVTPGIHPGYAQFMYRRIRIAAEHPLVQLCRDHGYPIEYQVGFDGKEDRNTLIVTFPYAYPKGTILAKDMTALDQLAWIKRMQTEWSDNSVSCTIYYKKEELPAIKEYLFKNYKDNHKSLSFLLHSDHGFKQAPYEEVTEEEYNELVAKTRIITKISSLNFDEGDSDCAGGVCPVR
jgi:intein/homing endonuclease